MTFLCLPRARTHGHLLRSLFVRWHVPADGRRRCLTPAVLLAYAIARSERSKSRGLSVADSTVNLTLTHTLTQTLNPEAHLTGDLSPTTGETGESWRASRLRREDVAAAGSQPLAASGLLWGLDGRSGLPAARPNDAPEHNWECLHLHFWRASKLARGRRHLLPAW